MSLPLTPDFEPNGKWWKPRQRSFLHPPWVDWTAYCERQGTDWHTNYLRYCSSEEHTVIEEYMFLIARYECEQCGNPDDLVMHHRHYKSLGQERPEDVDVLCQPCHMRVHAIEGWEDYFDGEEAA